MQTWQRHIAKDLPKPIRKPARQRIKIALSVNHPAEADQPT